jgi:hypothetical protein
MAFSAIFAGCPGAIDDLTDVNDKIKGSTITVMPSVGALDVVNATAAKSITKIEIKTLEKDELERTITGNITIGHHVSAFLVEGEHKVILTLSDGTSKSQNVTIDLDMVTTLTFNVDISKPDSDDQNEINVGIPQPPTGVPIEKGAIKVTNISAAGYATISNVKIQDVIAATTSIYAVAITGGGPSWVYPLEAGSYMVSISTNGTVYTEETPITVVGSTIIELKYANGHFVETNDESAEMGSLRVINNSPATFLAITHFKLEHTTTHEILEITAFIPGGSSYISMFPVGAYMVSISLDNAHTYSADSIVPIVIYKGSTTEVAYNNGIPDDGTGSESIFGSFKILNRIPSATIQAIKVFKIKIEGGTTVQDVVTVYASDTYFPIAYDNYAPPDEDGETYDLPLGTYNVAVKLTGDPDYLTSYGTITLLEGVTQLLTWNNTSGQPDYGQQVDRGTVQLIRTAKSGTDAETGTPDGLYPNSIITNIKLINTVTGMANDIMETGDELKTGKLVMTVGTNAKIPVGEYRVSITYKESSGLGAATYSINSTAADQQPVLVTVTKKTKTVLMHTLKNNYWD